MDNIDNEEETINSIEPECTEDPDVIEEVGVECEFEMKDGGWWCTTHNCSA
jgi:hypothetical protein